MKPAVVSILAACFLLWVTHGTAADWPQFLGPSRDGTTPEEAPGPWGPEGPRVVWRVPLEGYGSVAVSQGKVFALANRIVNDQREEWCVALHSLSGQEAWATRIGTPNAYSTPSVHDGRVYVYGAAGTLHCLNSTNGAVIWQCFMTNEVTLPQWIDNNSQSPLVEDGRVIVVSRGATNTVLAFDAEDGGLLWKGHDFRLNFASPVSGTLCGVPQVICRVQEGIVSISPSTGELLWEYYSRGDYLTPIVRGDTLLSMVGDQGVRNVIRTNDTWTFDMAWTNPEFTTTWTPPVFHNGHVYGIRGGALACFDYQTGQMMWSTNGFVSSGGLILAGSRLVVLGRDGRVTLVQPDAEEYLPLCTFQPFEEGVIECCNLPVVAEGRIYVRDSYETVCLDTNPPARLHLEICRDEPSCSLVVATEDDSMIDPARASQFSLLSSTNAGATSDGWLDFSVPWECTNGQVRYNDIQQGPQRFFMVVE